MSGAKQAVRLAALRAAGALLARREAGRPAALAPGSATARPRVLLIRPDHLGDVLLATPAAQMVRDAIPDAEITWLVGPWAQEVAGRAGGPAEILTLDFPGFTRRPKASPVEPYRLLYQEATRLRARQFDVALILRPDHWWGALLAAVAGIPRRLGYSVPECRPFLTDLLPPPSGHVVQANVALAQRAATALGAPEVVRRPVPAISFEIRAEETAWAGALIGAHLSPASSLSRTGTGPWDAPVAPVVAVHPGSGAAVKNWQVSRWAAVIHSLRQERGAEIVLTGGPAERDLVEQIAARLDPPPPMLAGQTTLGQLAALFAQCDLVLGGDSGPLHLAAAVGTPTVRLYGPTDTAEFGPWPPGEPHVALAAGLPCQPCRNLVLPPCGAVTLPACLRAITPEDVMAAAGRILRPIAPTKGTEGEVLDPC